MTRSPPVPPFDAVSMQLRARGLVIRAVPGGFCITIATARPRQPTTPNDLREALRVGLALPSPPNVEPPLGPMGRKTPRRARMYAHNRRIAAKRAAAAKARTEG